MLQVLTVVTVFKPLGQEGNEPRIRLFRFSFFFPWMTALGCKSASLTNYLKPPLRLG